MILLNFGWMVDLAMSIFEFLTKFLVFWHPWHPWVCIRSVCWKWNLKQIEAIPPSVTLIHYELLGVQSLTKMLRYHVKDFNAIILLSKWKCWFHRLSFFFQAHPFTFILSLRYSLITMRPIYYFDTWAIIWRGIVSGFSLVFPVFVLKLFCTDMEIKTKSIMLRKSWGNPGKSSEIR